MKKILKVIRVVLPVLILCGNVPKAEAKLFEVWGSGLVGYGYGQGNSAKDFYRWVRGGAVGVEVGAKVLFIGVFIDYLRWFGGSAGANLFTFNLGGDWDIGITENISLIIRAAGGYYHGTLPDDATMEIDDINIKMVNTRGIGVRAGPGIRYSFAKIFSVGTTAEFGYHYFFGGKEQSITDDNSSGFDFNILAYFRVGLGF